MKTFVFSFFTLVLLILSSGCESSNHDVDSNSIVNTKWSLGAIIDNETDSVTYFPDEIQDFEIIFMENGIIDLPDYCNYSHGKYKLSADDSLQIYDVGPGTEKYCLPALSMEWEELFINNLKASETYSIAGSVLTINCDSVYDLVFNYVEKYDPNKGKVLFCTNSNILNCVFEIEVAINNISYSLTAASTYNNYDCQCEDTLNIGLLVKLKEGTYDYTANELNCIADNKVNSWSGQVTVVKDECARVNLDVNK